MKWWIENTFDDCNIKIAAYELSFYVFGLHVNVSEDQLSEHLNSLFTSTELKGILEENYHAVGMVFSFLPVFIDHLKWYTDEVQTTDILQRIKDQVMIWHFIKMKRKFSFECSCIAIIDSIVLLLYLVYALSNGKTALFLKDNSLVVVGAGGRYNTTMTHILTVIRA